MDETSGNTVCTKMKALSQGRSKDVFAGPTRRKMKLLGCRSVKCVLIE